MLIIIPVNGLINRLRFILSSKILADYMNIPLFIFWKKEKDICMCDYNDIFEDNNDLWNYIPLNMKNEFENKYNVNLDQCPLFYNEINGISYLRGQHTGEQRYIENILNSKTVIKVITGGGNFYVPELKNKFDIMKSNLYNKIKFNNYIINNKYIIPEETLGVHLRYTDLNKVTDNLHDKVLLSVNNIVKLSTINNILIIGDNINEKTRLSDNLKLKYPNINIINNNGVLTNRNNTKDLQDAIIEWLALTECNYLIYFKNSSFGYESSIFNLKKKVIAI